MSPGAVHDRRSVVVVLLSREGFPGRSGGSLPAETLTACVGQSGVPSPFTALTWTSYVSPVSPETLAVRPVTPVTSVHSAAPVFRWRYS